MICCESLQQPRLHQTVTSDKLSCGELCDPASASRDGIEPVLTIIQAPSRVESLLTLKTFAPFGLYPSDDAFPAGGSPYRNSFDLNRRWRRQGLRADGPVPT